MNRDSVSTYSNCQEDFDKLEKEQKLLEAELQAKLPGEVGLNSEFIGDIHLA